MLSFIAERAAEDADALVRPNGERLTYSSLAMASAAIIQALDARVGEVQRKVVAIAVADAAGFVASLLAVLEAGGVALPLELARGEAALQADAERAHALAVIVGDAGEDRLDVIAGDAQRRQLPADAALILPAGARLAVLSSHGLGRVVDAIGSVHQWSRETRTRIGGDLAAPAMLGALLATLRAGGTLVDAGGPATAPWGLDLPEALRIGLCDGPFVRPLPGCRFDVEGDELLVDCPWAMLGYLDDDAATQLALSPAGETPRLRASWALEQALAATPGVREAALVAVPAGEGGARLVAYVDGAPPAWGGVKVVPVESLPHRPDGAIDRVALRRMTRPDG